jgi:hypothetical protein
VPFTENGTRLNTFRMLSMKQIMPFNIGIKILPMKVEWTRRSRTNQESQTGRFQHRTTLPLDAKGSLNIALHAL